MKFAPDALITRFVPFKYDGDPENNMLPLAVTLVKLVTQITVKMN